MLHFFLSLSFSLFFIPSQLVSKTKHNTELQKEICKHLGPWGPAKSSAAGGTLQPPPQPDKTGDQIHREHFPSPSGGAEHRAELASRRGDTNLQHYAENYTLHHLAEIWSKLKLTDFLEKKLNSSSQACLVHRRGSLLLIYQLPKGPLLRIYLHQRAHDAKESLGFNALCSDSPKLSDREGHAVQHSSVKKGQ
jgi:hypothetical protein